MTYDDVLKHVGILGMRWGKRKGKKATKSKVTTVVKAKPTSADNDIKNVLVKKKVSEMSNSEIKILNERLQLERTHKDLTKKEMSAGKKFVMELVTKIAKDKATEYITKYANKGLDKILK